MYLGHVVGWDGIASCKKLVCLLRPQRIVNILLVGRYYRQYILDFIEIA